MDGVDFQNTGEVKFVRKKEILEQLNMGNIVVLNNVGFSVTGELLNCNTYALACQTAAQLEADKLICMFDPEKIGKLNLPVWVPLQDAEKYLLSLIEKASEKVKEEKLDVFNNAPVFSRNVLPGPNGAVKPSKDK